MRISDTTVYIFITLSVLAGTFVFYNSKVIKCERSITSVKSKYEKLSAEIVDCHNLSKEGKPCISFEKTVAKLKSDVKNIYAIKKGFYGIKKEVNEYISYLTSKVKNKYDQNEMRRLSLNAYRINKELKNSEIRSCK